MFKNNLFSHHTLYPVEGYSSHFAFTNSSLTIGEVVIREEGRCCNMPLTGGESRYQSTQEGDLQLS